MEKNKYLQIYLSIMEKKMIFRDISDISIAGNNWKKKKINYNEKRKKNWCRNLEISYCMICIVRLYCGEQWQRQGAGLGIRRAQGRWGKSARAGALGHKRACWGAGAQARVLGRWGVRQSAGRAGVARTGALQAGGRAGERQARGAQQQARARAERVGQGWLGGRRAAWALGA